MPIERRSFGKTLAGEEASLYVLRAGDFLAAFSDFGATLVAFELPAGRGARVDVVLGFESAGAYERSTAYLGATVGRFANRIARGRFRIADREIALATNNGANHLHGGQRGFDKRLWSVDVGEKGDELLLRFERLSPDGEEGYPGALHVCATYALDPAGRLRVLFEARAESATIVNLTQHAYWNLRGAGNGDILGHELELAASRYLPVDAELIPTGEYASVEGGPFDFRKAKPIGRDLAAAGGYDHCFVIDRGSDDAEKLIPFARLRDPESGRAVRFSTSLPGVQLYDGFYLSGERGKNGAHYQRNAGLCLETELFPDAPNKPNFPSAHLASGELWRHETLFEFEP